MSENEENKVEEVKEEVTKTFNEARVLLATRINETYLIEPTTGNLLRNKRTGQLFSAGLCVDQESKIADYKQEINNSYSSVIESINEKLKIDYEKYNQNLGLIHIQ